MYTRNFLFRLNVMQETFDIRSCIDISANDIKIYTIYQYMLRDSELTSSQ